jgi:hypothetical protein
MERLSFFQILRTPEYDIVGLLVPWWMVISVLGFLVAWFIVWWMEVGGVTRWVWHLPLFFLALAVLSTSLLGLLLLPS